MSVASARLFFNSLFRTLVPCRSPAPAQELNPPAPEAHIPSALPLAPPVNEPQTEFWGPENWSARPNRSLISCVISATTMLNAYAVPQTLIPRAEPLSHQPDRDGSSTKESH